MKYLARVSYDGSKYYGFQKLNDCKSVQKEIEEALTKLNKSECTIKGAGRTDRGVHALDQCISFTLDINIPTKNIKPVLNKMLPPSIRINKVIEVPNTFHPRFEAKYKIYEYIINIGEYDVIQNDYLYNYCRKLSITKMRKAAKYLLGAHSFENFTSGEREHYNSIIYNITIHQNKNILKITFKGKSFYRYMVRNMVGALISVGREKNSPEQVEKMLNGESRNYTTAPANGLYLKKIEY